MKPGDSGPGVSRLQQQLIEAGELIGQYELNEGLYGPATTLAVHAFQARHVDTRPGRLYGHPLIVDGVAGPATLYALAHPGGGGKFTCPGWAYDSNSITARVRPVTDAAFSQIGEFEKPDGSNQVAGNRYGNGDQPWCAYFVSWAYGHMDGGSPFGVMASVFKLQEWANKYGRVVSGDVQPGDLWTVKKGDYHGHVELITRVTADGLWCIGGNVSNAVRGTKRTRESATLIVRP